MKTRHVYSTRDIEGAKVCVQAALRAGVQHDNVSLIAKGKLESGAGA